LLTHILHLLDKCNQMYKMHGTWIKTVKGYHMCRTTKEGTQLKKITEFIQIPSFLLR
jgi:hypothetical protein